MNEYVRSGFQRSPLENWETQWDYLRANLLIPVENNGTEQQSETGF